MLLRLSVRACATKCEKCEEGKAYILRLKSFEDVSAVSHHPEREVVIFSQDDHALCLLCYALLLSRTHCS